MFSFHLRLDHPVDPFPSGLRTKSLNAFIYLYSGVTGPFVNFLAILAVSFDIGRKTTIFRTQKGYFFCM